MENNNLSRCLLYYPTISIPSGRWLKKAVLYWDEIGSIVPQRYDETELVPYSSVIKHLKDEKIFRPFRPESLTQRDWGKLEELEQEFKKILLSEKYQNFINHQRFVPLPKDQPPLARIHEDKVSGSLFHFLEQRKLAKRESNGHSEWLYFENNTALLYMALLAKHIADNDANYTVPGTDFFAYESLIYQAMSSEDGIGCLQTNFENCLPIPRDDVPMKKIVDFKRRRRNELLHFRQEIDEYQHTLRQCQDKKEVTEVTITFKEKIERNVRDLEAVMKDGNVATMAGSLKTLVKADSPALWATIGVAAGQATKITDIPLEWSAVGIGILGTIEITSYLVDKVNENRATIRNSPFAYLYHAKRANLFPQPKRGYR